MAAGTRLGPHVIIGPLGAGAMGEVYLARDTRLDREVALKLLPRRVAREPEAVARLRHEALTLASLSHPNIATVYGFEETPDGGMALVLERVEGETLAERLRRGPLPLHEALHVCTQVAHALEAAHERGVIHRDVKPSNVMIGPRGLVKVLDFGIARRTLGLRPADGPTLEPPRRSGEDPAADEDAPTIVIAGDTTDSTTGMTVGTPGYMSPEQVRAGPFDERTDVFAFGSVLFECLTGRPAFDGGDVRERMKATLEADVDITAIPPAVPARVTALIERCLVKGPEGRLPTMRAARVELEEALGIRHASALREGEAVATPNNLPAVSTGFVGRTAILAECARLLDGARMLTLVGLGGSGKTRLALKLAESRLISHPGGVWFVDVAPLVEPHRVAEMLGATLGVREVPGRSLLQGITEILARSSALVLLDNAESHAGACAQLAHHLLGTCPDVRLLATSREPLHAAGEVVFTVPPLSLPTAEGTSALHASEAVELFVERARAVNPGFELTDDNAAIVADLCRRLDGIPLAIELAAARARLLGVEQIHARLSDRFKLLAGDARVPARQQTVRAVVEWSWDQLMPPERDLARRLAVFTGGWTLERAARICTEGEDEFAILDLLSRLVERSMVTVQRAGDVVVRYRFLETVWRFALEQLEASAEHETLRERHLEEFLQLAERAETAMMGPGLARQLAELEPEEENILAALAWCARARDGGRRALRLATCAYRYWSILGRYEMGRRVMEEALEHEGAREPSSLRAKALARAAGLALNLGDVSPARRYLEEGLQICRRIGEVKGEARSLSGLAVVAMIDGRLEDAQAFTEGGLRLYQTLGEPRGVGMALHNLGILDGLMKRPDLGRAYFERALELLREVGDHATEVLSLASLADCLVQLGDREGARRRLHEAIVQLQGFDAPREALYVLDALAEWLHATGRSAEAARFFGAVAAARDDLDLRHFPHEAAQSQALWHRIARTVGDAEANRLAAAGRALSRKDAVAEAWAYVREELPPLNAGESSRSRTP